MIKFMQPHVSSMQARKSDQKRFLKSSTSISMHCRRIQLSIKILLNTIITTFRKKHHVTWCLMKAFDWTDVRRRKSDQYGAKSIIYLHLMDPPCSPAGKHNLYQRSRWAQSWTSR